MRIIGYVIVGWTFYSVFAVVGLGSVYRRYDLGDAQFAPPLNFWMLSSADSYGVLSDFRFPLDQIYGLLAASLVCAAFILLIQSRSPLVAAAVAGPGVILVPWLSLAYLFLDSNAFYRTATLDKLIPNDMAEMPKVFWIGGALEYGGVVLAPALMLVSVSIASVMRIVILRRKQRV